MSFGDWRYWWPERGETEENEHYFDAREDRTHEFVASDVAEYDFHRGDPWTEAVLVLVSPGGERVEYAIEVEARPHFYVRPTQSKGEVQK